MSTSSNNDLEGRRYIALARCSTGQQADTSIDDQLKAIHAFAKRHGMVLVAEIRLEGFSGSLPGGRYDIEDLVRRKMDKDDFDALVVYDISRFTRGGIRHGFKIECDLWAVGIRLLSASDGTVPSEFEDVFRSFQYAAAQEQARAISRSSTRGSMTALQEGRSAYTRRAPYGIDKLYCKPDGTQLHILRALPDGRQLMLHPETRALVQEFPPNDPGGSRRHYVKQKDEKVQLILGADECVALVRDIYRWHFVDGLGCYRIAKRLNDKGIQAPAGGDWSESTVQRILQNPIYTGRAVANRQTRGIYHRRADAGPAPSLIDKGELHKRRHPPIVIRPQEEWVEIELDALKDFLDPDVRELAVEKQQQHLDRFASGRTPKPNRDRHRGSSYILKGILTSRQGGYPRSRRNRMKNRSCLVFISFVACCRL